MGIEIAPEEVPYLADYFVKKYCEELACPPKRITPEVMKLLQEFPWSGPLQELENVIKRAVLKSPRSLLIAELELPPPFRTEADMESVALEEIVRKKLAHFFSKWHGYEMTDLYEEVIKRVERPLIQLILEKTGGNQVRAAKLLGVHRNTLAYKLKGLGIR